MKRQVVLIIAVAASGLVSPARADHCSQPGCEGPDVNLDCRVNVADLGVILGNFGLTGATPEQGDTNGDHEVNVGDLGALLAAFGTDCGDVVDPNAPDPNDMSAADLIAYRPRHGAGYAPFIRTPVADADEQSDTLGPGIRVNGPGDADPAGEDDLIEVTVEISPADTDFALRRENENLLVWTTPDKQSGTQLAFANNRTGALPFATGQTTLTLWVEWGTSALGTADLQIERLSGGPAKDTLRFHAFESIVIALGGEGQVPTDPADSNSGTFVVAVDLYNRGYDVHMYDEDVVSADGSGAAYDEVVTAVQSRLVDQVAIFGYSHGGGSTYDLAERLDNNRATIGMFEIQYTSYVDSVGNNSDIDLSQELRRPPATAFHENHYQHGTLADFYLDGGPVPDSNPPPTGLDVETTSWGADATHFLVDDYSQVRDAISAELNAHLVR